MNEVIMPRKKKNDKIPHHSEADARNANAFICRIQTFFVLRVSSPKYYMDSVPVSKTLKNFEKL